MIFRTIRTKYIVSMLLFLSIAWFVRYSYGPESEHYFVLTGFAWGIYIGGWLERTRWLESLDPSLFKSRDPQ